MESTQLFANSALSLFAHTSDKSPKEKSVLVREIPPGLLHPQSELFPANKPTLGNTVKKICSEFAYPDWVARIYHQNKKRFLLEGVRIYQFQENGPQGIFIFGIVITTDNSVYIDHCIPTDRHTPRRRKVLEPIIKSISHNPQSSFS